MASGIKHANALNGLIVPGRRRRGHEADITILELTGHAQYQIRARNGRAAALARCIARQLGRSKPLSPLEGGVAGNIFMAATGPEEFWATSMKRATRGTLVALEKLAAGDASTFDQSEGRCLVRISGPGSMDLLAKGTLLDLSNPALPPRWASHTSLEHIPALILKQDTGNMFDVSLARSYARSFAHWLLEAASEYEVNVL